MKNEEQIREIDKKISDEIGKRNHVRQIYVEFMCVCLAAIAATDLKLELDRKDLVTWNIADDIARRTNKLEAGYRVAMDTNLLYQYCDLMNLFEERIEKQMKALKERCNDPIIYTAMHFMLLIDAINDNIKASKGGIVHRSIKDIKQGIDKRWYDIFKRKKLSDKAMACYRSQEYKDVRAVMLSNWHMERVYHKKIKQI